MENNKFSKYFPFFSISKSKSIIILIILIIIISYFLFFYSERVNEENIINKTFLQQRDDQIESTKVMALHIGSDLKLIMSILQGLTDSIYLQQGELYGDRIDKLVTEKFRDIQDTTKVDGLFIADKDDIITSNIVSKGERSFVNIDISFRAYIQEIKSKLKPVFSDGYKGLDGKFKISLLAPIINRENNQYIGTIAVEIPTNDFFGHYGNINNINSSFLVAYDKKSNYIATPRTQLLGESFFGDKVQSFFNLTTIQNDYYRKVFTNDLSINSTVYDFGSGERLNTGQPILLQGEPKYFVFVITPTALIYAAIKDALFFERISSFSLILGFTSAVVAGIIFLAKWNRTLDKKVKQRTKQFEESNKKLLSAIEELKKHEIMQKEFINIAAHELRTPIQTITGYIKLAQKFPENFVRYLEPLARNSARLNGLTEDILDVSRIESGTLKLVKEESNFIELVYDTITEFKNQFQNTKNNSFKIIYDNGIYTKENIDNVNEDIFIYVDKGRIQQLLINLLSNANNFTENGQIIVKITKSKDKEVIISIEDTGQGIDPEILPRLFEKFVTKSERGTGLGLYISKNIVEAHGGRIWCVNNDSKDRGAKFMFTLPLYKNKIGTQKEK